MGMDFKRLLLTNEQAVNWLAEKHGVKAVPGVWLEVTALEDAVAVGKRLRAPVVHWSIHTVSDTLSLDAFVGGRRVRSISLDCDDAFSPNARYSWMVRGKPLPFEDQKALAKWLRRRHILASPDGYDVLKAFLGAEWNDSTPLANVESPELTWEPEPRPLEDAFYQRRWKALVKLARMREHRKEAGHALVLAVSSGERQAIDALLRAGVDPNSVDERGKAPVHCTQEPALVAKLVRAGADPNLIDGSGETPLMGAVTNVNPNTRGYVHALLKAGADPSRRKKGRSVLTLLHDFLRANKRSRQFADGIEELLTAALEEAASEPLAQAGKRLRR